MAAKQSAGEKFVQMNVEQQAKMIKSMFRDLQSAIRHHIGQAPDKAEAKRIWIHNAIHLASVVNAMKNRP